SAGRGFDPLRAHLGRCRVVSKLNRRGPGSGPGVIDSQPSAGMHLALWAGGAPSRRALRAGSRAGDTAPSVLPMICEDGHPDRWSDLMNASFFRGRVQAATAMVAAALIALAGCGPAEDPPAPETDTVEHEGPAGDETEHDGDGNSDDDPAADANEEDRTRGDDVQGS